MLAPPGAAVADHTGWVRPARNGVVVVTSRDGRASVGGSNTRIDRVGRLPTDDAAAMLLDLTGGHGGSNDDARLLAERLGGLPLALRLAGSYLASTARAAPWSGLVRDFEGYRGALDDARGSSARKCAAGRRAAAGRSARGHPYLRTVAGPAGRPGAPMPGR